MAAQYATASLPSSVKERNILALVERGAREYPNRLALVGGSADSGEERLTYSQLDWRIRRAADALRSAGLRAKAHVALLLSNACAVDYVTIAFGAMRLGAVVVPLNTRYAADEQAYSIDAMDVEALVYEAAYSDLVDRLRPRLSRVDTFIALGKGAAPEALDWSALYGSADGGSEGPADISEDSVADILLTSGTTGYPKGVVLTHANAVATGIAISGALGLRETDVYQSAFPLFTSSGFHFNLLSVLTVGATMVIEPVFDARAMLEGITRERTTVYLGVPAAYIFMMEVYDPSVHDVSSIRLFDYGGAPMAKDVIRRLFETFPGVELRQTYGLTEAGPTGTYLPGELAISKLGSVGSSMPLCDVHCLRPDLTPVAPGEVGEIVMRGPTVMRGYYRNEEATNAAIHDGWLWTGDLGTVDEDGLLYYVDRNKDIIIRGGFNISSMEVENAVFEHPDVQEVAVVAIPHEKLGEDVCAFVVRRPATTVTAEDIRDFCRDRIADYKIPRHIHFVDELPRNPTGKIQKNVLRDRARDGDQS
ncbi:MAG: AMP-binding protein [Ectothiorhodospiraceae bacterium]|nr:AMP-binding protein [Ectothiorhodospiraceae bacterium]